MYIKNYFSRAFYDTEPLANPKGEIMKPVWAIIGLFFIATAGAHAAL